MYTRMAPEKKPDPYSGGRSSNSQRKPPSTENKPKKLKVRTMDYLMIMQLILKNPDAILPDELLLLQRSIGTNEALLFIKKAKEQKQLEKMGVPGENKQVTLAQFNQNIIQQSIQKKSPNTNPTTEQVQNVHMSQEGTSVPGSGLPPALKNSLEKLSGVSLSDVEVHKNSDKPQQLGALAYTQGKDIYITPGQEEHLPHEGWHAVQQKQDRVPPTLQMKSSLAINEDQKLEKEADIMGSKAEEESRNGETQIEEKSQVVSNSGNRNIIQMATDKKAQGKRKIRLWEPNSRAVAEVDADNTQTIELLERRGYVKTSKDKKENWVLKVGNSYIKNDVIVLQKVLVKSGYLDMPKDPATQQHIHFGTYGELTKQAVMKFQNKMGMKADGIVGPGTWKAMQLPWSKETNEPHREHHQYTIILNNKSIYNDGIKASDDKTPSNEKTKKTGGEIDYLANIKSNLYILGYKNVYKDYKSARDQFLKDYFDNGHSLHADFIRMGEGEHNSTVLKWTNKALAHQISRHGQDAQGVGDGDKELNNYIDQYYKFALDYFNDPQVSWFTPYRSDVKYVWQFIDNNAKALGLSEYQVKLLKADYVFYSECTVENLSLMWSEMNNPFDGWMLVNAKRPGYKALNNAKGIRNKIAGKIKGLKNKHNSKTDNSNVAVKTKDTANSGANVAVKAKDIAKNVTKVADKAKETAKDTGEAKKKDNTNKDKVKAKDTTQDIDIDTDNDMEKDNEASNTRPYTKSNLKMGLEMHKVYKADVVDNITKFKEFRLPSGKRVDFIDFKTKTIYELKPYNPNGIKAGMKQLEVYKKEVERYYGSGWKTVLDTY